MMPCNLYLVTSGAPISDKRRWQHKKDIQYKEELDATHRHLEK